MVDVVDVASDILERQLPHHREMVSQLPLPQVAEEYKTEITVRDGTAE